MPIAINTRPKIVPSAIHVAPVLTMKQFSHSDDRYRERSDATERRRVSTKNSEFHKNGYPILYPRRSENQILYPRRSETIYSEEWTRIIISTYIRTSKLYSRRPNHTLKSNSLLFQFDISTIYWYRILTRTIFDRKPSKHAISTTFQELHRSTSAISKLPAPNAAFLSEVPTTTAEATPESCSRENRPTAARGKEDRSHTIKEQLPAYGRVAVRVRICNCLRRQQRASISIACPCLSQSVCPSTSVSLVCVRIYLPSQPTSDTWWRRVRKTRRLSCTCSVGIPLKIVDRYCPFAYACLS